MARWELIEPHYLIVLDQDGEVATKWEYMETDRTTGRQKRKQYDVPQFFHHEDETCWTEYEIGPMGAKIAGKVIVTNRFDKAHPKDVLFKGEPTPGMKAVDDEAHAISAKFKDKWAQPDRLYSEYEGTYAQRAMDKYVESQDKVNLQLAQANTTRVEGMAEFMQVMSNIMRQNQEMMFHMMGKQLNVQQTVDHLGPLPTELVPEVGEVAPNTMPPPPPIRRGATAPGYRRY